MKTNLEEPSVCPKCGTEFTCSKSKRCWCFEIDIPAEQLEAIEKEFNSCLCPKCLKEYAN